MFPRPHPAFEPPKDGEPKKRQRSYAPPHCVCVAPERTATRTVEEIAAIERVDQRRAACHYRVNLATCSGCSHISAAGICQLFNFPANRDRGVCDFWDKS